MPGNLRDIFFGPQPAGVNPDIATLLSTLQGSGALGAPTATAAPAPASSFDPQIEEAIKALSTPEPVYEAPVESGPSLRLSRVLAAIADAGSNYAHGLNPYVSEGNALGSILGMDRLRERQIAENTTRKASAKYAGDQRGAEARLRELISQRDTRARSEEASLARGERKTERAEDREDRQVEAKVAFTRSAVLEKELANIRGDFALREQGLRNKAKSEIDEVERRQLAREARSAVLDVKAGVVALKPQIQEMLKTQTPEQIRETFIEAMDIKGLKGEDRKEPLDYFLEKIEPALRAREDEQARAESTASLARQNRNAYEDAETMRTARGTSLELRPRAGR